MIGFIQGKVIASDGIKVLLLTNSGIGYEINYGYVANVDDEVGLHIHHHITDNDQSLWGFNSLEDKKMFELLKTVNKVGSSKAYPLISTLGTRVVIDAIIMDQQNVLTSVKGIGKKMAEQIILSLRDKVKQFGVTPNETSPILDIQIDQSQSPLNEKLIDQSLLAETLSALESLGYKDKNISTIAREVYSPEINSSEDLLKRVLREI